jgi:hypothetical protein
MSIAWRACASDPSLIWMFHSATGSTVPPPLGGGGGGGGLADDEEPDDEAPTVKSSIFIPPVSKYNVSCCVPAPSVTGTETTVQFCHPPVAGTPTLFQTLLAPLNPTWNDAPPGAATRSQTVYDPGLGTFTV